MAKVRIKDLEIPELEKYLEAYQIKLDYDPSDEDTMFKIKSIKKALKDRALLGIDTKPDKTGFIQRALINKLKK